MPHNKNQHYVPQFYLKLFSNNQDQKTFGIWNIEKEIFVRSGSIRDQASLDYFYGKDLELEKAFGQQETLMSQIYSYILETKYLFKPTSIYVEYSYFHINTSCRRIPTQITSLNHPS